MKGKKKIFHANSKQKRVRVAILLSGKIGLKSETVIRDKEGHYMLIKDIRRDTSIGILEKEE